MILLEVIWWLFFVHFCTGCNLSWLFFHRHTVCWHTHTHTHTHTPQAQAASAAAKETEWGRKSEGGYIDEARGLLFSLLISLNLLIPILKPATLQCCRLLCVAPSQIKLSFIPVPFKHRGIHRSSISTAFSCSALASSLSIPRRPV